MTDQGQRFFATYLDSALNRIDDDIAFLRETIDSFDAERADEIQNINAKFDRLKTETEADLADAQAMAVDAKPRIEKLRDFLGDAAAKNAFMAKLDPAQNTDVVYPEFRRAAEECFNRYAQMAYDLTVAAHGKDLARNVSLGIMGLSVADAVFLHQSSAVLSFAFGACIVYPGQSLTNIRGIAVNPAKEWLSKKFVSVNQAALRNGFTNAWRAMMAMEDTSGLGADGVRSRFVERAIQHIVDDGSLDKALFDGFYVALDRAMAGGTGNLLRAAIAKQKYPARTAWGLLTKSAALKAPAQA